MYVYFANRDELLRACVQSMYDAMLDTIAAITETAATPPELCAA